MYRRHLKIAVMLLALLGTLFTTGQASAAPTQSDGTYGTTGTITRMTAVPSNGRVSCFGYYGTFKTGTYVMVVDWVTASDECFGIATDRTIWHVWPNSGGWKPMPGGGHADFIYSEIYENVTTGARGVSVFASSNGTYWCQNYYP
ncbi:MAG: hypothetical protein M3422_00510, partial [Actinomycetota bacterium]|nr:hypothetical protein [Actinomycetota bacterium]